MSVPHEYPRARVSPLYTASSAVSAQLVELSARCQVADWRQLRNAQLAGNADAERRRALERVQSLEAGAAAMRAALGEAERSRDEAMARADALAAREADLSAALAAEAGVRADEVSRVRLQMSDEVEHALLRATAEADSAREAAVAQALALAARERQAAEAAAAAGASRELATAVAADREACPRV